MMYEQGVKTPPSLALPGGTDPLAPVVGPGRLAERWLCTDLDLWTRHVIRRNFHPALGSPYWLDRAETLPFDPFDVTRYDQLEQFGPLPLDPLRDQDPGLLVPLAVRRSAARQVWETADPTGRRCGLLHTSDMLEFRAAWECWSLAAGGFAAGRAWLQATPHGPRLAADCSAEADGRCPSAVYGIEMDPTWPERLASSGRQSDAAGYLAGLVDQIRDVLVARHVDYLNTTPGLFHALLYRHPAAVRKLAGVWLTGAPITAAAYREFRAALDGGAVGTFLVDTFGSWVGLAPEDGDAVLPYLPCYPHVTATVVDERDWRSTVPYGRAGRVRVTVLHENLFLPNIVKPDRAQRLHPGGRWPFDGLASILSRPAAPAADDRA